MVKLMQSRYNNSEFKDLSGVSVEIDTETDYVEKTELVKKLERPSEPQRFVRGLIADNQRLPFEDGFFDCYISNLSLMIVPDYKQ